MRLILIFILSCSFLLADRDGGPYIGFGYGVSKYHDDGLYDKLKKDTSKSITIYGGAYINKYLSVELENVSFDAFSTDAGYEIDDTKSLNFNALNISTLAHYAFFEDSLDFYAKFGVSQISLSGVSGSGFSLVSGGGIAYRINKILALKLAYDLYTFDYDEDGDSINDKSMSIDFVYSAIEVQF